MAKTKRTADSQRRLKNFKNRNKNMSEQKQQAANAAANQQPQMPAVIEQPYWQATDKIDMNGKEFEHLYNGVHQLQQLSQGLFGVANSIMQRNIFDGTVKVKFQKLVDVDGSQEYVDMTDEEQAPHQEEFQKLVESLKANRDKAQELVDVQGPLLDAIVDKDGNIPGTTPQIVDQDGDPVLSGAVNITPEPQSGN